MFLPEILTFLNPNTNIAYKSRGSRADKTYDIRAYDINNFYITESGAAPPQKVNMHVSHKEGEMF